MKHYEIDQSIYFDFFQFKVNSRLFTQQFKKRKRPLLNFKKRFFLNRPNLKFPFTTEINLEEMTEMIFVSDPSNGRRF